MGNYCAPPPPADLPRLPPLRAGTENDICLPSLLVPEILDLTVKLELGKSGSSSSMALKFCIGFVTVTCFPPKLWVAPLGDIS